MKYISIVITTLVLLIGVRSVASQDSTFTLKISCVENQPDRAIIYFGYASSAPIDGISYFSPTGSYAIDGAGLSFLEAGEHERVFRLEAYYPGRWDFITPEGVSAGIDFNATTTGASCSSWQPSAPSIHIPLIADCSLIDVKDYYEGEWTGNWSRVQSNGEDVLLHYGESLTGGQNQSTNPSDYRSTPTDCY